MTVDPERAAQIRRAAARFNTELNSCPANARKGTGTGTCARPLDEHGQCGRAADHIGEGA